MSRNWLGLVVDRAALQGLEARIRERLHGLGIDETDQLAEADAMDAEADAAAPLLKYEDHADAMGDLAPLGPFPTDALVEAEIGKAREGDWRARRQLGLWWRHFMDGTGGPGVLPRALYQYLAEAFDHGDLDTALDLRREPGRRGRDPHSEDGLRKARAAIVRYVALEHGEDFRAGFRHAFQMLGYVAPDTLKRNCRQHLTEAIEAEGMFQVPEEDLERERLHYIAIHALRAVRLLLQQ